MLYVTRLGIELLVTHVTSQPVLDLQDLRILALGTLDRPRTNFPVNPNAHLFLNPPGVYANPVESNTISNSRSLQKPSNSLGDFGVYPMSATAIPSYCN